MQVDRVGILSCASCSEIQTIVQTNEQIIKEQVRFIKQLHEQNSSINEKYQKLEHQYKLLNSAYQEHLFGSKDKIDSYAQTDVEDKIEEQTIEIQNVQPQQLKLSTKINTQSPEKKKSKPKEQINKENLEKLLPIVTMRKDEVYFSRKRKNSFEEDHYTSIWLKAVDPVTLGNPQKFKQKTLSLIKKMIPHQIRHMVWPAVCRNTLVITDELYCELQQRKSLGWMSRQVQSQIDKDVSRSFLGKGHYEQRQGLKIEVSEVLQLFHLYRPDVSYIQGMTYPVIVLTLIVGKIKAFSIFANLVIGNSFFRRLYTFQPNFVQIVSRTFQLLLFDYYPEIAEKLAHQKIDPQIFIVEWFFTIFSRSLSFQSTLKFWDQLLYHGEVVLFRLAISIFELIKTHIMTTNYQNTVGLIQGFGGYIREDKLFQLVVNHRLTHDKLQKSLQKMEKLWKLHGNLD